MKKLLYLIRFEFAKLLSTLGYKSLGEKLWRAADKQKNITNNSSEILSRFYGSRSDATYTTNWINYYSSKTIKIYVTNFWGNFNLSDNFLKYIFDICFSSWEEVYEVGQADIIITSVFPHTRSPYPEKTIAIIWENIRPDYRFYRFSLSSDFDNYGGRNIRCPLWYAEIKWSSECKRVNTSGGGAHGIEPLVTLEYLMTPRLNFQKRRKFCSFIAGNPESHRMLSVEALNAIAPVDIYGPISGKIETRSKYVVLEDYVFNLCFENSIFPGYYTEKLLQAWAAGTIPLYFSERYVEEDFNTKAFINKSNYKNLNDFINDVSRLYSDDLAMAKIWREPLITKKPSLDPVIEFLRLATFKIIENF